jgi:hypothetical protein
MMALAEFPERVSSVLLIMIDTNGIIHELSSNRGMKVISPSYNDEFRAGLVSPGPN